MVVRRWTHYYSCTCGLYVEGTGTIYQRTRQGGDARTSAVIRRRRSARCYEGQSTRDRPLMCDKIDPLQEAASTESAQIIRSRNDTVERHFWLLTNAIHSSNHVIQLYQYIACCLRICRLCAFEPCEQHCIGRLRKMRHCLRWYGASARSSKLPTGYTPRVVQRTSQNLPMLPYELLECDFFSRMCNQQR